MEFIHFENKIVSYSEKGKVIAEITFPYIDTETVDINYTYVDPSLRGRGTAGLLMNELITELNTRKLKAVPTCSYAIKWFEKHTEYAFLLK